MESHEQRNRDAYIKPELFHTSELKGGVQVAEALQNFRLAAIRGDLEAVKTALVKGLTVNQTLRGGWTALMYACSMCHSTVIEYLLQQGANPNFQKELFTPLMATCASMQADEEKIVQCVALLLQYKADVNTSERHHTSALMFAAKQGHNKVVSYLLTNNCNCDINARDSQGWTALFWAVNQGKTSVVETLIKNGASSGIQDRRGRTAIDLARNKGFDQVINLLTINPTQPLNTRPELNHQNSSDVKPKYVFGKTADSMLPMILGELLASVINNNGRCENNFARLLNRMELENSLVMLKDHGQVISKIAHSVNDCIKNSILQMNKCSQKLDVKSSKPMKTSWKNIPYSALEARKMLGHTVRHVEGLHASMSYVRLLMQGNPPAALVEDKLARISEITVLSGKALQCTRLLYDEIFFFHQYAKQLEESECIVPADIVVEQKADQPYSKLISSCVVVAAIIVIILNSRVFTVSIFSK